MRYKPRSLAALHIALGGLPGKMRVSCHQNRRMRGLSAWSYEPRSAEDVRAI